MINNLKKIVGTVAPFLGSMIGGPFGGTVGAVIGKALLGNENATDDDIAKAIGRATPEELAELKRIDADYKVKMAQIGIDEEKIHALDRDSARKRNVAMNDRIPSILALFLTCGFFGVLGCLMFFPVKEEARQVIDIMLGSLGTAWISVITYYFGSSVGSKEKTQIMEHK